MPDQETWETYIDIQPDGPGTRRSNGPNALSLNNIETVYRSEVPTTRDLEVIMALINIDNSKSVWGELVSLSIRDAGGNSIIIIDQSTSRETIADVLLTHAAGLASNLTVASLRHHITMMLENASERSLYGIQCDLNHGDWQQTRLQATAEFRPTWAKDWTGTLLVRTTWQEEA